MKKFKHILIFLLLVETTLVINAGTKAKPSAGKSEVKEFIKTKLSPGFPDLITFTNYFNQ